MTKIIAFINPKARKQYIYYPLKYQILKTQKPINYDEYMLSRKTVYSGISKLIMLFLYSFHILCTIPSIVKIHTVLSLLPFLLYRSHLKTGTVHSRDLSLSHKSLIIGQSNIPAATAENKEQDTLSNIIYIAFQILTLFFEVFLDKQGRQIS